VVAPTKPEKQERQARGMGGAKRGLQPLKKRESGGVFPREIEVFKKGRGFGETREKGKTNDGIPRLKPPHKKNATKKKNGDGRGGEAAKGRRKQIVGARGTSDLPPKCKKNRKVQMLRCELGGVRPAVWGPKVVGAPDTTGGKKQAGIQPSLARRCTTCGSEKGKSLEILTNKGTACVCGNTKCVEGGINPSTEGSEPVACSSEVNRQGGKWRGGNKGGKKTKKSGKKRNPQDRRESQGGPFPAKTCAQFGTKT